MVLCLVTVDLFVTNPDPDIDIDPNSDLTLTLILTPRNPAF